jgi:hypothetical protein
MMTEHSARELLAEEFERSKPWNPAKDESVPARLYCRGIGWDKRLTAHGEANFLTVRDDDGVLWSILVGDYKLRKSLLEGELSEWSDEAQGFVVTAVLGPVEVEEAFAIEYRGRRSYTNTEGRTVDAPDWRVLRKPGPKTDRAAQAPNASVEGAPMGERQ